jgi:hypothetical protein
MANTFAPFGFRQCGSNIGVTTGFNFPTTDYLIANADGTNVFSGDPVTLLTTGFVTRSTAGTTTIAGIFAGCKYFSTSLQRTVWSPYWPGSGATGNITAQVIDDPNAVFMVQVGNAGAAGGPVVQADVGANVQFALGTGSTATGLSGAYIDYSVTPAVTATLPFRVLNLLSSVDIRTDNTSAGNLILVTFNAQQFKTTTGI